PRAYDGRARVYPPSSALGSATSERKRASHANGAGRRGPASERVRESEGRSPSDQYLVGATGFEPATPCAQGRCATRLRYAPTRLSYRQSQIGNRAIEEPSIDRWPCNCRLPIRDCR